jgi:hypothetical protein
VATRNELARCWCAHAQATSRAHSKSFSSHSYGFVHYRHGHGHGHGHSACATRVLTHWSERSGQVRPLWKEHTVRSARYTVSATPLLTVFTWILLVSALSTGRFLHYLHVLDVRVDDELLRGNPTPLPRTLVGRKHVNALRLTVLLLPLPSFSLQVAGKRSPGRIVAVPRTQHRNRQGVSHAAASSSNRIKQWPRTVLPSSFVACGPLVPPMLQLLNLLFFALFRFTCRRLSTGISRRRLSSMTVRFTFCNNPPPLHTSSSCLLSSPPHARHLASPLVPH